jgi:hypothetical protein
MMIDTEIAPKISDMTIHWKALEEHFLMVASVIRFISGVKMHFMKFSEKLFHKS